MSVETAPGTDMWSPIRYVVTALEDARLEGRAVPLEELTTHYEHSVSGDLSRFRKFSKADDDRTALRWVIQEAIFRLGSDVITVADGFTLAKPMASIRYQRKRLVPLRPPSQARRALHNLRKTVGPLDDLISSMKEEGWRNEFPAVRDRDTEEILSGNRRLKAAQKAGVEPVIVVRTFGSDYERLRFAINANAQRPLTKDERDAAIVALKEAEPALSTREIGAMVGVNHSTVVRALNTGANAPVCETPHKRQARAVTPELEQEIVRRVLDEGEGMNIVGKELLGVKGHTPWSVQVPVIKEEGRREERAKFVGRHCQACADPDHCPGM